MGASGLPIDRSRASPNHGVRVGVGRPDSLVLHYTGMRDEASAIDWLCDPVSQVSCHYVVTETGRVFQLVDENRRAWHAGRSVWRGMRDMNSASVGIEIVNGGHEFGLPAYPDAQVKAVVSLCRDIMERHAISADRVLAHSDIAPSRKRDPGERFPWRRLAETGVGLWPVVSRADAADCAIDDREVGRDLIRLGYGLSPTGAPDADAATVLRAFQRRYRPELIDGVADAETVVRLRAVLRLQGLDP